MIRIQINKKQFQEYTWNKNVICQEEITREYSSKCTLNGEQTNIKITGQVTLTGETPDYYECSRFKWEINNDLHGQWNPNYNQEAFINGNYSLDDYVDDEIIDSITTENNKEVEHNYYITNLPPAAEISMNNPVNMKVEREYNGVNKEITPEILELINWRNWYSPDPNGLGTKDPLKFIGEVLGGKQ